MCTGHHDVGVTVIGNTRRAGTGRITVDIFLLVLTVISAPQFLVDFLQETLLAVDSRGDTRFVQPLGILLGFVACFEKFLAHTRGIVCCRLGSEKHGALAQFIDDIHVTAIFDQTRTHLVTLFQHAN